MYGPWPDPWPGTSQPLRSVSYRDVSRLVGTS